MIKVHVNLDETTYNILVAFGRNLSDVVNKILDEYTVGNIDIVNKPMCPSLEGTRRYCVNINNEDYEELYLQYGPTSPYISLRRLLYWFVDEEIYEELDWNVIVKITDEYKKGVNDFKKALNKLYGTILTEIDVTNIANRLLNRS